MEQHSPMFETLKKRYEINFCRIDQLRTYVKLGKITPDEFYEITGKQYEV